jgi:Protein of unknown function (DUF3300)
MKPSPQPYEFEQFDPSRSRLALRDKLAHNPTCLVQTFKRVIALSLAVLMLPLAEGELLAQDQQPPAQGYSYNDPYDGQYNSGQQPDYGQHAYPDADQQNSQPDYGQAQPASQPLNLGQLEQLVAPVALYPDTLLAQVLAASTYPTQVMQADRWLRSQSPDQIAQGADVQNWDPSVKALTAFPQVLAEMDQNLQWTTDLGNAYYNQPQDVLEAVQIMRRRAQLAGTLQSTPQERVSYDQGNIELTPPNPQFVYVPAYNPWGVYGAAVTPYPGFSLFGIVESFLGSAVVRYGVGIAMAAFTHMTWGWLAWGLSWLTHSLLFNRANYFSASSTVIDRGFPHGGPRARFWHEAVSGYGPRWSNYNATSRRPYVPRPLMRNAGNRLAENSRSTYSRGHSMPAHLIRNVPRPAIEAHNRPPAASGFRSGFLSADRAPGSYAARSEIYRGSSGVDPRAHSYRSSSRSSSGTFPRPAPRYSPAYHVRESAVFSQSRASSNFLGGGHASRSFHVDRPHGLKPFSGGRHFGGGHSGEGHHSSGHHPGGHSGGRHHH